MKKDIPCHNCITYAICKTLFNNHCKSEEPYDHSSIRARIKIVDNCQIIRNWMFSQNLLIFKRKEKFHFYFRGWMKDERSPM